MRMYEDGVTLEAAAESARLRTDLAMREALLRREDVSRLPPSPQQQRAWACDALVMESERHQRGVLGVAEEMADPSLPDRTSCSRYCALFSSCGGGTEFASDAAWNCVDECTAGAFGREDWVRRVGELGSCRYM